MPDRDGVCPREELLRVIGGKWKVIILWHVLSGTGCSPARSSYVPRWARDSCWDLPTLALVLEAGSLSG